MSALEKRLLPLVNQARGRCHSCAHQERFDLPVSGSIYFCRTYGVEYNQEQRDLVRACPKWTPYRPPEGYGRAARSTRNPLLTGLIEDEDQLFWQLKVHLDDLGIDLKSVLVLAQPAITTADELAWVDTLEDRFADDALIPVIAPLGEIIEELRALRYSSVCDVLQPVVAKASVRADDAS